MKNKFVTSGLLFFVLLSTFHVTHSVAAEQTPAQKTAQLTSQINSISKSVKLKENKMNRLQKTIYSTDQQITRLSQSLSDIQEKIRVTRDRLSGLNDEKAQLVVEIAESNRSLAEISRIFYMLQRESPLKVMINQENIAQSQRIKTYHDYLIKEFEHRTQNYRRHLQSLENLDQSLLKKIEKLDRLAARNRKQTEKLNKRYEQRSKDLSRLTAEVKSGSERIKDLKADQKRLEKLAREIEKLKIIKKSSGMSFAKRSGGLTWPVKGRVIRKFGRLRAGSKLKWRGVLIETQAGAGVSAVAGGRVVFADWLTGYGYVLIVEHGQGYMSLYAHNQQLLKNVGDKVQENQQIALAGNSGRSGKPALYFEIRHKGKPVNPAKWIVARKTHH